MSKRLKLDICSIAMLPEIVSIIEEMIRLFNDFDGSSIYFKLSSEVTNTAVSRYQLYESKDALLQAIQANCPYGCNLVHE